METKKQWLGYGNLDWQLIPNIVICILLCAIVVGNLLNHEMMMLGWMLCNRGILDELVRESI